MNPIIKWPGGKSREIGMIQPLIPEYNRYIEPFFGGGALFFHLKPKKAAINDISESLIQYYRLIQKQDKELYELLVCYDNSFTDVVDLCKEEAIHLKNLFFKLMDGKIDSAALDVYLNELIFRLTDKINAEFEIKLVLDREEFINSLFRMARDKYARTVVNFKKSPFTDEDLLNNLITGFTSGFYMYFRKVFNDICLERIDGVSLQYRAANFYFIREYCYGSMFRYNSLGEFNIPYGGMSYNKKNMKTKIDNMFNDEVKELFQNAEIHCCDFEEFFQNIRLTGRDFMFLDPPYDTDFSDYEGRSFSKEDQIRLANSLKNTPAKFILVIKNTEFIYSLYRDNFRIMSFDKQYSYNVRSRNDRDVKHLIITNIQD